MTLMHTFHCPTRPVPRALDKLAELLAPQVIHATWNAESLYVEAGTLGALPVVSAVAKAGIRATFVLTEDMDEGPGA